MPKLTAPLYVGAFFGGLMFVSGVLLSFPAQKAPPSADDDKDGSSGCSSGTCCVKCAPDIGRLTFASLLVLALAFAAAFALFNRNLLPGGAKTGATA